MTRIALATCGAFPDGDPDDELLLAALPEAEFAVWDDPAVDWDAFDLVVIRSTWDYQDRIDTFLAWVRSVPRLVNPREVIEWNTDKRYLGELPGAVATAFLGPGEPFFAPAGEYVVKPSVSAGSRDTARFAAGEEERAASLVARIHATGRTAMVQPYVHAVDHEGEAALLFFDGVFSHAIRKASILQPGADIGPGRRGAPRGNAGRRRRYHRLRDESIRFRRAQGPPVARCSGARGEFRVT